MKSHKSESSTAVAEVPATVQGDGSPALISAPVDESEDELMEMSFLDHLEDLRWSILKGLGVLVLAVLVCIPFSSWITDVVLLGPAKADFFMYRFFGIDAETLDLQNRTITGQFFAHIGIIVSVGLVLGSPAIVYFLWKFIEPGLYKKERRGMRFAAVFATFFFILGLLFGYLIITPLALQFFANYQISDQIANDFDIMKYFSMVTFWSFGVGVLFELPVVVYFLAKVGILDDVFLRSARKYALIVVLVLGALFTPPDPVSQVLVAIPLYLLYELSIQIAGRVARQRAAEMKAALE